MTSMIAMEIPHINKKSFKKSILIDTLKKNLEQMDDVHAKIICLQCLIFGAQSDSVFPVWVRIGAPNRGNNMGLVGT